MTAAEKRMQELLDRWLASVDLHQRYLKLDDAAYARAEAWPRHQRPTTWIVDLARQRLQELQAQLRQRRDSGDTSFAEALELMSFLTGLLGSEHLERFIPTATGEAPDASVSATVQRPRLRTAKTATPRTPEPPPAKPAAAHATSKSNTGSHKRVAKPAADPAPQKPAVAPRAATPSASPAPARVTAPPRPAAPAPAEPPPPPDSVAKVVIADAVRMLEWGREWPTLAGLIARMADRPNEADVWKILRAHRSSILTKARRPAS